MMISSVIGIFILLTFWFEQATCKSNNWDHWWSYVGISGPDFWGQIYNGYIMCSTGKQQSPIDIVPDLLLFDPNLKHLRIDSVNVNGYLSNTGNDITFKIHDGDGFHVNVSEGPLSYVYRLTQIKFHFGDRDSHGSEHTINEKPFPGEMQMIGYNSDLYGNISQAEKAVKGLVIISAFLDISPKDKQNRAFQALISKFNKIQRKDDNIIIHAFSIAELLPKTDFYITYEGSMTQPGCHESVTWVIFNKPTFLSQEQLSLFRTEVDQEWHNKHMGGMDISDSQTSPQWFSSNARPVMPVNHRVIRTNINFQRNKSKVCTMERDTFYQGLYRTCNIITAWLPNSNLMHWLEFLQYDFLKNKFASN